MSVLTLLSLILLVPASLHATPQKAFTGCLNRLPDGTLQFGAVPSGELFLLRGRTNVLQEHVNQLVRVFGEMVSGGRDNHSQPTLLAARVQTLAESCTSVLPAKQLEAVAGKVGEDDVAVPLTTTFTEDQSTPGFQTENATAPSTRSQGRSAIWTVEPPAGPPHPEQVAQSEAAANVDAGAVERTEILPGHTLGVSGSAATAGTPPAGTQPAAGPPRKPPASSAVVNISGGAAPKLSPPRVTIRIGQAVQWLNSSAKVQELIANPARETQLSGAALPAGAKPFDSGFLRRGHSFERVFSVPGVYHYLCKINDATNPAQAVGEVIVQR